MNNYSLGRFFRVQGGNFPNRSREHLRIEKKGLFVPNSRAIHIGDSDHLNYFLQKRLDINHSNTLENDFRSLNVSVVEMYVPYAFSYIIEQYAVSEYMNRNNDFPKLVDKNTPGKSYQIKKCWSKLLEECCVYAHKHDILTKDNILNLLFHQQLNNEGLKQLHQEHICSLLMECNVEKSDINIFNGLTFTKKKTR